MALNLPVRCVTCGKLFTMTMYEQYKEELIKKIKTEEWSTMQVGGALDKIGLKRFCCRRMFIPLTVSDEQVMLIHAKHIAKVPVFPVSQLMSDVSTWDLHTHDK